MKKAFTFIASVGLFVGLTGCNKICKECDCTRVNTVTQALLSGVTLEDTETSTHTFTACKDFDNAGLDLEYWESNPTIVDVTDITGIDPVTGETVKTGTRTERTTNDCSCE